MKSPHTCHVEQHTGNEVHIRFVCHNEDDASELFERLRDRARTGVLDISIVTDETTVTAWAVNKLTLRGK